MTSIEKKSVHELRAMAQAMGVKDVFQIGRAELLNEIAKKSSEMVKVELPPVPPRPMYDARLMTKPPAKKIEDVNIDTLMKPYVDLGLRFKHDEESWSMSYLKKTDSGSMRMPPRILLQCAEKIMR